MKNKCPNCDREITIAGRFIKSGNPLLPEETNLAIDHYLSKTGGAYCYICSQNIEEDIKKQLQQINKIIAESNKDLEQLPIVSIHSPKGWDYEVLEIVTGQSTTGTGVISEIGSSFTDLFGAQSNMYNNKLAKGENLCFHQMRAKTLQLGGNAIVALDLDYSELGGIKGMIMVCATGTAVKLKNTDIIKRKWDKTQKLKDKMTRSTYLSQLSHYLKCTRAQAYSSSTK